MCGGFRIWIKLQSFEKYIFPIVTGTKVQIKWYRTPPADQLTLFQPGRADSTQPLLLALPIFFTFRHPCVILNFLTCKQRYWTFQNKIVNLFTMDKVCEAIKKMHRVKRKLLQKMPSTLNKAYSQNTMN